MAARQPLKRLREDYSNESTNKRKPVLFDEENINPHQSEESASSTKPGISSLLRAAEWGVKPDTPAIKSVKSRIQKLNDSLYEANVMGSDCESENQRNDSMGELRNSEVSNTTGVEDQELLQVTDHAVVRSVVDMFERKGTPEPLPPSEPIHLQTESTRAICVKLYNQQETTPSASNERRIRMEREQELVLVRGLLDHQNPWREEVLKQRSSKSFNQEEVIPDLDHLTRDIPEDHICSNVAEETNVSSLEVRLKSCSAEAKRDSWKLTSRVHAVTFPAELEAIPSPSNESDSAPSLDQKAAEHESCPEQSPAMNSSAMIDKIFNGVLDSEDLETSKLNVNFQEGQQEDLPPFTFLSPLAKSVNLESVVTPLNSVVSSLPELSDNDTPSDTSLISVDDYAPPYSIDAYRSLRRNITHAGREGTLAGTKNTLLGVSGGTPESALDSDNLNLKDKIKLLNEEVTALQRIIQQTSQALNCCVDEEHGKGSREEAEAERLLLVSSEKCVSLLNMLRRLKSGELPETASPPSESRPEPCRGSVTVSDLRLPLKMDYLCSVMNRTGKPNHYFLLLIRFGSHYIVATPLASVQDALSGDAIVFPTSVTLNDASSTFEMDIEVYSLTSNGVAAAVEKRRSTRSKITPKKLLSAKKPIVSPVCSPSTGSSTRTSSFLLVGSHKVTLESLSKTKFPLDKMKFEGKVGRLLGAHFQDKVPFLSPLEGNIHLKLKCQSHSKVQHSGFLTMFDDVSGFGVWHRRWCTLSANCLSYWTYPDQEKTKDPLGQINLFNCSNPQIEAANWEFCARPNTLELITMRPQQDDDKETLVTQCRDTICFTKNWLSADTKEERNSWMKQLNQVLVDLRTWQAASTSVALPPQFLQTDRDKSVATLCRKPDHSKPVTSHGKQSDPVIPVRETEC